MTKNVWRCRCGKRAEVLTDENFGDCGCSDPVYGPEYFYMSEECADMLDEMDKDYDEQHKHLAEARAALDALSLEVGQALVLRSVDFSAGEDVGLRSHAIWVAMRETIKERDNARAEIERKDKLIERMREALELLIVPGEVLPSEYLRQIKLAKAALSSAERGEK